MGFDHWVLGMGHKESLVRMGFALSEIIRY